VRYTTRPFTLALLISGACVTDAHAQIGGEKNTVQVDGGGLGVTQSGSGSVEYYQTTNHGFSPEQFEQMVVNVQRVYGRLLEDQREFFSSRRSQSDVNYDNTATWLASLEFGSATVRNPAQMIAEFARNIDGA